MELLFVAVSVNKPLVTSKRLQLIYAPWSRPNIAAVSFKMLWWTQDCDSWLFSLIYEKTVQCNVLTHFIHVGSRHESASGYYRVSVYFFGQVLADIIPNRFIPTLLLSVIVYFLFGECYEHHSACRFPES